MTTTDFERLVAEGIDAIPAQFQQRLKNVVVTVADQPSPEQLQKGGVKTGYTLFGLYEGIPQTRRGSGYTLVLPDKITIFKKPIVEAAANDPQEIKRLVKETVWHEIAHHFGLDEKTVRDREAKRRAS